MVGLGNTSNKDNMCFGCSPQNPIGLQLTFKLDGDKVYTTFKPRDEHQGYSGYMHGGLISTLMDETMAQWLWLHDIPCMTVEMTIRYSLAVLVGQELAVEAWCVAQRRNKLYEMAGRLILPDGRVAVRSEAKFLRVEGIKY